MKNMTRPIKKSQQSSSRINRKRSTPRHMIKPFLEKQNLRDCGWQIYPIRNKEGNSSG